MSVHTMPSMSIICEDFLKSMVKSSEAKTPQDPYSRSSADDDALTTRLNGDINGYGSQTDDEDEQDAATELDNKLTNGFSPLSISSKELRKDLMKKTEELKRSQKSMGSKQSALPTANEAEESILRKLASQVLSYDF